MAVAVKTTRREESPDRSNNRGLTPSDQLLGIFLVNFIILIWVGIAFAFWYERFPELPNEMYVAELIILLLSFGLALFDTLWSRVSDLSLGPDGDPSIIKVDVRILKIAVFGLTLLYIFVLWRLAEETGGVISPFAPLLTAPALFAPFVTKNGKTIIALSILVSCAIFVSNETETLGLDSLWPYKGTAAVMVLLAGVLTALRMRVAKRGAPLTGEGSDPEPPASPESNGQ
jgi:ABC-type Mn2+/Zn2+ transport system permease subunit